MAIRSIIVPLTPGLDEDDTMGRAISVAQTLSAHLEVAFVRPDPETHYAYTGILPSDSMSRDIRERMSEAGKAAAESARRKFGRLCRKAGLARSTKPQPGPATASWREVTGEPATLVPSLARNADLAVFSGGFAISDLVFGSLMEATLLGSGNPVLYLPATATEPRFSRPLIAWDGRMPCVRAISAWLSMGVAPDEAVVLHVADTGGEPPDLDGVASRIGWHVANVRTRVLERGEQSVAKALLAEAEQLQCGLIVMGGYSRYRYSEALFGGVTRHIIRHASIPVLIMH